MKNKLNVDKQINLKKKVKSLKDMVVKVGFPSESSKTLSTDQEGVTAVFKATIHNFGLGVPKRPFMDIAFAKNKKEYKKIILKKFSKIEDLNIVQFVNKLGLKAQGDVQKSIIDLRLPANDPETVEAKGSSNPLIDTGHMLQSVTFEVSKK
jgi:hypothetical protein